MNVTRDRNSTAAVVLIAIGVVALLGTLGVFRFIADLLGALLFGGLAYFAYTEGRRRGSDAWRLAAYPLAGLAVAAIAPFGLGQGAFLASLGLAFAVYWHADKTRWWALIPAGALGTLGLVESFDGLFGGAPGWLFLAGMALTFFALTRLEVEPQPWAVWPAAGLALLAFLSLVDGGGWVLPLLLIAAGAAIPSDRSPRRRRSTSSRRRTPRSRRGRKARRTPDPDTPERGRGPAGAAPGVVTGGRGARPTPTGRADGAGRAGPHPTPATRYSSRVRASGSIA